MHEQAVPPTTRPGPGPAVAHPNTELAPRASSSLATPPALLLSSPSTVLILAGGLGTRLRPVHGTQQKVLAGIAGRPFLSFLLEKVAAAGYRDVVLCTGFRGDDVEREFGASFGPVRLRYSREEIPLGTGGALRLAADLVQSERVLALNGDSYCDVDLLAFEHWAIEVGATAALVATEVADTSRFGRVELEGDRVTAFVEKGGGHQPGWVNAGVYSLSTQSLLGLPRTRPFSLERELLERTLDGALRAFRHRGRFLDIGTPESLAAAQEFFDGEL